MAGIDANGLRGRRVLVTGAGGFIGAAVVRRLVALGADVRALAGPPAEAAALRPPPAPVRPVYGEIDDGELLARLVDGVECVYHLAGPPSVAASFDAPARTLRIHAVGTAALFEACAAAGVRRLVHVSSAEVYAPASGPVGEEHARAPRSPYGAAKLAAELLLESCAERAGVQVTILRPFSVYGPGGPARSLVSELVGALARGEPPRVADPRPVRDYVFVDDAAEAIARAALREGAPVRAFNLASGLGVSVAELVRALLAAAGRAEDAPLARAPDRPAAGLTLELVGDPRRARDEIGFSPATSLAIGLARTARAQGAAARRD
jgi:nucleoside-diphosphate-sugar epimerase